MHRENGKLVQNFSWGTLRDETTWESLSIYGGDLRESECKRRERIQLPHVKVQRWT
jgi:hypothetical protein